ncbi:MAG TPA: AMIN domain-containing protein [Candidatus Sulfotelmatobacter sp.]
MKLTIQLTTGILAVAMMVSGSAATQAVAQNADAIDNARRTAKALQQNPASPAPKAAPVPAATKPAPGAPASAVKPAAIPGAKPASASHNQLQGVHVAPGADGFQIEISSSQAVTPNVTKLTSPARLLVELPDTIVASAQNKIPVGSGGVKGVRIGMDGKTPPTTSVVVDLEKQLAYELTPGSAGKLILILHTEGASAVAKNAPAPAVKAPAPAAKPAAAPAKVLVAKTPAAKPVIVPAKVAVAKMPASKLVAEVPKMETKQAAKTATTAATIKTAAPVLDAPSAAAKSPSLAKAKPEDKKWAMNGKRDPFFSPVVQTNGSGCSTGKKCLEIGGINLRGVVKSDSGFIAVVTNNLNKAYFLRENDPVFNGYVVKITGDSVVFQETIQDKLGKPFTREVVKRIFTPAV